VESQWTDSFIIGSNVAVGPLGCLDKPVVQNLCLVENYALKHIDSMSVPKLMYIVPFIDNNGLKKCMNFIDHLGVAWLAVVDLTPRTCTSVPRWWYCVGLAVKQPSL